MASALSESRASALDTPRVRSKRKTEVLDEDEWTRQIESIVERDFFPDLPKLRNKLEWLQAIQTGDPLVIRQAQLNIAQRRAGLRTPMGATPHNLATPQLGSLLRTPAGIATPGATPAPTLDAVARDDQQEAAAPPVSLDKFMAANTSEDNASFAEIMADSAKRRRLTKPWLFEDRNKAYQVPALEGPRPLDGYGTSGQPVDGLISWPYTNKNRLYYDSSEHEAVALTDHELALQVQGKPKQIRHANTRLPSSAAASTPSPGTPASGSQPAGFVPSRESVGTPALAPGVDASPLVTWGALGGTPLRLDDQDDIDLDPSDGRDGPRFRLSQTSRRDLLGREISQRATASLKRAPVPRFDGTPSQQPQSTPQNRVGTPAAKLPLSAAGKRLASSLRAGTPSSADTALRASYARPRHASQGTPRTPQWSPWLNRGSTPSLEPGVRARNAASGLQKPAHVTDDLLDI